ncbi:hypothetical protein [Streptomyces sp. NPDC058086]|uniref:hypothetical protein n=1 Tax=Streptomyces sp. NPDC058086 TaxID=3346334 RepID=UPI0036E70BE1
MVALEVENVLDGGTGVLGFVEQDVAGVDAWVGELPDLQVVVVLDLEFVSGRVLNVFPHAQRVGKDGGGQYLMDSGSGKLARRAWQICSGLHRRSRRSWMNFRKAGFCPIFPGLGRGRRASARSRAA